MWAYGSRVTWNADERSDLDVAVFDCSPAEIGNLKEALEESNLLISVDVMDWQNIPEKFRANIKKKYVVAQRGLKEWREVKLSDCCEITRGGSPRPIHDYIVPSGTPWVKIADATNENSRYISKTKEFIKPEGESKSRVVYPGDFIVSNSATPGLPRFMKIRACIHDGWLLFRNITNINKLFLYYLILKERETILTQGSGTIFTNLKTDILKNHTVFIPSLPEQKAIAEVLTSLDDKIDLLYRQNKTLEDMAQTLFRKWFVEDADEGWEEKPLDKVAHYLNGLACQKYPPRNEVDRLPVLKIKDLRNGIDENSDWVASEVKDEYIVKRGDIIFSWSGSLMIKIWDGVTCVLNQHLFKVSSTEYPKWYIYLWTKHHIDKFVQIAESKATTMGHIKRGDLSGSMVLVPASKELLEMNNTISPLFEKVIHNFKQIYTLKKLRDTMLPELMSGKIRIKI